MDKKVLFYNEKKKELSLKIIVPQREFDLHAIMADPAMENFGKWAVSKFPKTVVQDVADWLLEHGEMPSSISHTYTLHLLDGDEFDLYLGCALLLLEVYFGSKRQRNLYLEEHYGELLTDATYRHLVIASTLQKCFEGTYAEFKEFVDTIYANNK